MASKRRFVCSWWCWTRPVAIASRAPRSGDWLDTPTLSNTGLNMLRIVVVLQPCCSTFCVVERLEHRVAEPGAPIVRLHKMYVRNYYHGRSQWTSWTILSPWLRTASIKWMIRAYTHLPRGDTQHARVTLALLPAMTKHRIGSTPTPWRRGLCPARDAIPAAAHPHSRVWMPLQSVRFGSNRSTAEQAARVGYTKNVVRASTSLTSPSRIPVYGVKK